jgi:hypothetical protein
MHSPWSRSDGGWVRVHGLVVTIFCSFAIRRTWRTVFKVCKALVETCHKLGKLFLELFVSDL